LDFVVEVVIALSVHASPGLGFITAAMPSTKYGYDLRFFGKRRIRKSDGADKSTKVAKYLPIP